MAQEIWEIPVQVFSDYESFPSEGEENKIYIDESTGTGVDNVSAFVWMEEGGGYSFIGRVPKPNV